MSWFDQLQQASFRGVPFGVQGAQGKFGRRVALHEYPNRDKPYVEDMGRSTRKITLTGFLVENSLVYGGGDVFAQRDAMVSAAETAGKGTLVHPTLGELQVSVPDGGLTVSERWDQGRYFELGFSFIESGDRLFPTVSATTPDALGSLANSLDLSAALDFISGVTRPLNLALGTVQGALSLGSAVEATVYSTVGGFIRQVASVAQDATGLFNLASALTGQNLGRFVNTSVSSAFSGVGVNATSPYTIASLESEGAQSRATVATASAALSDAADGLDAGSATTFVDAAQKLTASLSDAIVNPADAVRLFGSLATYQPADSASAGQMVTAQNVAQDATSALLRRAAIGALARAVAAYQPSSYDDAANVRGTVVGYMDAEILIAGNAGDDGSYGALRALRQMLVANLIQAGAGLPRLQRFAFNASLPALMLAEHIYGDAGRSEQLIAQAQPVHPAFMPVSFQALAI